MPSPVRRRMLGRFVTVAAVAVLSLGTRQVMGQAPGNPYYGNPAYSNGVAPASYAAGAWASGQATGPSTPVIHERMLSQDRGWGYRDTQLDHVLRRVRENSWLRLDYMLWASKAPGSHLLGTPIQSVSNPRLPFVVTAPGSGAALGTATVPVLDSLNLRDANAMRATLGLRMVDGTFEANVFGFTENADDLSVPDLGAQEFGPSEGGGPPPLPKFAATSTLVNGELGNNQFLYDHSFRAKYAQDLWGTGFNYVVHPSSAGPGLKIMPMFGFRYFEVNEGLYQTGVFNGGFDGVVDLGEDLNSNGQLDPGEDVNGDEILDLGLVSHIDSIVNNELFAPQLGVRFELQHQWFALGFEPKLALGVNRYESQVSTSQLRSFDDPLTIATASGNRFTQIADFRFYAKLHPSDRMSLFVAYDIMIVGGVSRAYDNVYYNDNGTNEPPAFGVQPGFESFWWQGLTVGGEFQLR